MTNNRDVIVVTNTAARRTNKVQNIDSHVLKYENKTLLNNIK